MKKLLLKSYILLTVLAVSTCTRSDLNSDTISESAPPNNDVQYNPYEGTTNVYFGDLHIHTKNSFDAYIFNVRNTPNDVYRFAKGETIRHPLGYEIKIWGNPLDFVAATDHGAYMGILPAMHDPNSPLSKVDLAKGMFSTNPDAVTLAFSRMGSSVRSGIPYEDIYDRELIDSTWQHSVNVANKHYEPGKLTTFAGYEYTAVTTGKRGDHSFIGGNLHRNVIFRDSAPDRVFATLDSVNPEDLWDWMDNQRELGHDSMAIPHNSNVSNGEMFDLQTFDGEPFTQDYAIQRIRNEPIVEMTQVKGTSETHPALSPNDEWADFEIYEYLLSSTVLSKINGSYVREALARGLAIKEEIGTNPYKFGMIGSSDTHVAGGAFDEKDFWSKVGILDATAESRGSIPPNNKKSWEGVQLPIHSQYWFSAWGASGLAAVWAPQNTREDIFDAMRRKETYATTGPRIKVRFFGGFNFNDKDIAATDLTSKGYSQGVPMGGTLTPRHKNKSTGLKSQTAPRFIVWAARDPRSAPLQRIQIVKVWHNNAQVKKQLYDVVCSDGLMPDKVTNRCADNGATVDLSNCSISSDKGAPELKTIWQDPDFKPDQSAAYYVRVLENPTCRWSTWDAIKNNAPRNPKLKPILQERAYTSPIWYDAQ